MHNSLPGIFITKGLNEKEAKLDSYATLFLSFTLGMQCKNPIHLTSQSNIKKYNFLSKDYLITKAINAYFSNGGKKLLILPQPTDENILFSNDRYLEYLSQKCDTLIDVETILAVDLFEKDFSKEEFQNSISDYCDKSSRLSLSDLPLELDNDYSLGIYNSMVFYPWIQNKTGDSIPTSVYVAALLSKLAYDGNISLSVANRVLLDAVDLSTKLNDDVKTKLYKNRVNTVVYSKDEGYKLWGVKTLYHDKEFEYINVLRVYRYIKRIIYQIVRQYTFDENNYDLKNRIIRQVENFLYPLWKSGALQGEKKDEAFLVICSDQNNSIDDENAGVLNIDIGVSIAKPLEYIVIHLNRVQKDSNQANINIS
jgi:hypothetical protein